MSVCFARIRRPSGASSLWDFLRCSSQPAATRQLQPASHASQAASRAEPASQPASVASRHRSLRPPGIDVSNLLYRGIQSVPIWPHPLASVLIRWHRLSSLLAPTAPGGQANMPQTYQISMIWQTFQQIESWDDHFRNLRSRSKVYRVQDASFIGGPSIQ